jgi:DNA polymerase-3 subunit epsilon
MTYLVVDTETSGLWRRGLPHTDPAQPHLMQLSASLHDEYGRTLGHLSSYIKPDGWSVEADALETHGISEHRARDYGTPLMFVLAMFRGLVEANGRGDIVAHNAEFDRAVLRSAIYRTGTSERWLESRAGQWFCTMVESTDIVQAKSAYWGHKWPTLGEAFAHFFPGEDYADSHDADQDREVTNRIYRRLRHYTVAEGDKRYVIATPAPAA